ncbi:hypothetical protein [Streptomyces chumphonensis]|uniref:hypothetical protein n=1 Tax=Streptomyces chumphonensis TaxID=1214925 RepID=UPI003D76569F
MTITDSAGAAEYPPARALRRCARCAELTQEGRFVGEQDGRPVHVCPACLRPSETDAR